MFRANQQIKSPEVFLIDENGSRVGVVKTERALAMAAEAELDLVEVNPTEHPPVVKILDYGQFKYEREKLAHKKKVQQKKVEIKGIRLSVRISQNDFNFKHDQALGFLKKGHKLKIEIILKGRERQHPRKAIETINKFVEALERDTELKIIKEQPLTRKGAGFIIILANKSS